MVCLPIRQDLFLVIDKVSTDLGISYYDGDRTAAHRMLAGKYHLMLRDIRDLNLHRTRFVTLAHEHGVKVRDSVARLINHVAKGTAQEMLDVAKGTEQEMLDTFDEDEWPCIPDIDLFAPCQASDATTVGHEASRQPKRNRNTQPKIKLRINPRP